MTELLLRPPEDDDELWEAVFTLTGVKIPRVRVCPHHCSPFDAFSDAYFARHPVTVWKASRGFGGKSTLMGTLVWVEAVLLASQGTVLGGSAAQSQRVHEVTHELWYSPLAPKNLLASDPTTFKTRLKNKAWIIALMASQKSVRGPHPQRLRLDEIDEMEMDILEAAQGQPQEARNIDSQTVMSSTHQYPDGTMSAIIQRAADKGWPLMEWCIAEGELVTTKRGEVPIQRVREDDLVLTRNGWKPVQHVTLMGVKDCTKLILADGSSLTCTPDHLLRSPTGWVAADSALTVTTIRPDVPVVGATSLADSVTLPMPPCPLCVGSDLYTLKMLQSDTSSVAAQVVDAVSVGDRPIDLLPHNAVHAGRGLLPTFPDVLDGVPTTESALPCNAVGFHAHHSTVVGRETAGPHKVYDIGVYDEHEFVANGVLVHNCWRESMGTEEEPGWLKESMVLRKQAEISKQMWDTEYDLQEPSFDNRAITTEFVDLCFREDLGVFEFDDEKELIFQEPDPQGQYIHGVDWAKENDWTVIRTFRVDLPRWEEVAFQRIQRKTWTYMVHLVNKRWDKYGGMIVHDATGLGSVVDDLLEVPRPNVKPIVMVGRERESMFIEYIAAIEHEDFICPRVSFTYSEHKYVRATDLFTSSGHPPDSFVAGALAWSQRRRALSQPVKIHSVLKPGGSQWQIN